MTKKRTFLLAAAIPLLILAAMTIRPEATVVLGKEILLQTKAVDPTDLFRGDYVSINLAISEIPESMAPDALLNLRKKTLYVSLKPAGKFYEVERVSETKPKEGIYLAGKIRNDVYTPSGTFYVDYSLDKYFVEQGSGKDLQQRSYQAGLIGRVKVFGGYGVLVGLTPS
ncbi:GDYXXLXY domain-containing protein [Desulfosporosinus sp. SYSU MS00001]|uniref:GDYXXLXY domain-containing protein n=1 Tax=Desulfosporosinus sp. SYSU MS00001 TaxID=3416284 RepID=UPI003CE87EB0